MFQYTSWWKAHFSIKIENKSKETSPLASLNWSRVLVTTVEAGRCWPCSFAHVDSYHLFCVPWCAHFLLCFSHTVFWQELLWSMSLKVLFQLFAIEVIISLQHYLGYCKYSDYWFSVSNHVSLDSIIFVFSGKLPGTLPASSKVSDRWFSLCLLYSAITTPLPSSFGIFWRVSIPSH